MCFSYIYVATIQALVITLRFIKIFHLPLVMKVKHSKGPHKFIYISINT